MIWYGIPMLYVAAVVIIEYRDFRRRTKEYRELEHFAEFLSNLKNYFYLCKNITESVFRATEQVSGSLRKKLERVGFLLEDDLTKKETVEETFSGHLKYLRLFEMQCRSAIRYGSGKSSTESVFIKTMTELRRDVQSECYRRTEAMHHFSGMGLIAVAPVLFLPVFRFFGSVTMEELREFYEGSIGGWIVFVFLLLTGYCYFLLYLLRQSDRRLNKRAYGLFRLTGRGRERSERFGMAGEVLNLQAVILLLLDVPNITILQLLDALGACAELFRRPFLQCADEYISGDVAALEQLRDGQTYEPFCQLAGRLIAAEKIGLKEAFSELSSDRRFFREQMGLELEQEQKKKVANAQIIAFVPMVFLLFAYLIIPFLWVSFAQMGDIFYEMEQIRYF